MKNSIKNLRNKHWDEEDSISKEHFITNVIYFETQTVLLNETFNATKALKVALYK